MKKVCKWTVVCLIVLLVVAGCGFLKAITGDSFAGDWIGIVKIPGMGKSVLRVKIEPEDSDRYQVHATAENYQQKREEGDKNQSEKRFVWQTGAEMRFNGQLESDTLHLNRMMQLSLRLSKITGTLRFPDGTEIHKDTGKEYPVLKEELRKMTEAEHPGAKFEDLKK